MNTPDVENYKRRLEAKRAELAAGHRNIESIAVERVADSMDEVILANEPHLALCAQTREATDNAQGVEQDGLSRPLATAA
jgi:hypothetical protein